MHRVHTKTSPLVFTGSFQRICHLYSTRSPTLNFSKPKLKLTKIRCRISISGPAIWNDFVKDCLKSIEKPPFLKVNLKSKLLNFDNEISYFQYPKMIVVTIKGLMIRPNGFLRVLPLLFHQDSTVNDVTMLLEIVILHSFFCNLIYMCNVNLEERIKKKKRKKRKFQNRCPFLYNSSAFLLSFFASYSRIVWILFYLKTSSLEPFSLFNDPDSILLYKRKMAMETKLFILF